METPVENIATMQQACEHIVKAGILKNENGIAPTAKEIFAYSPTGELSKIFEWYDMASQKLGVFANGNKYEAPMPLSEIFKPKSNQ